MDKLKSLNMDDIDMEDEEADQIFLYNIDFNSKDGIDYSSKKIIKNNLEKSDK